MRHLWIGLGFVGLVFLGVLLAPNPLLKLQSIGVTLNLVMPIGHGRPLEVFTPEPVVEETTITSPSGRTLQLRRYRPASAVGASQPALVMYSPFAAGGLDDLRMVNLGRTFAKAGFLVAMPWRLDDPKIISLKDIDDVVATYVDTANQPGITRVGILGISYGVGPAFAAAVDPRLPKSPTFLISFAGYFEFRQMVEFIRTGRYAYGHLRGRLTPDLFPREVYARTVAYSGMNESVFLESKLLHELSERLSPAQMIDQLQSDVFVMHAIDDRTIPYTESLRLVDALRQRGHQVTFGLVSMFEHGQYKPLTFRNIVQAYLPSLQTFESIIERLLSRHGRR